MTYEQMFLAVKAICPDVALHCRAEGNWYVLCPGLEIGGRSVLTGAVGNGSTPENAIQDLWTSLVRALSADRFLVVRATRDDRRHYRWAGFMWQELPQ